WLGIDVDLEAGEATVILEVLTIPEEGPAPDDTTATLILGGVSRVVASLRSGRWNDAEAAVQPLALADLDGIVRSFGGCSIYGWEFVDPRPESWRDWRDRLSLDAKLSADAGSHVLELFQESGTG